MAESKIESKSTEELKKSLHIMRWLLPLLVVVTVLSSIVILFNLFVDRDFKDVSYLLGSTLFCLFMSLYFYAERKKIFAELEKRKD
jgi:hypothetical protein